MTSQTSVSARDRQLTAVGVIGFAATMALAAQIAIPIPGTPVPFTLQPLAVVLAGMCLGPVAGAASMVLYLLAGILGLPVFSPIGAPGVLRLIGPTGGYLLAAPAAAAIAGLVARGIKNISVDTMNASTASSATMTVNCPCTGLPCKSRNCKETVCVPPGCTFAAPGEMFTFR